MKTHLPTYLIVILLLAATAPESSAQLNVRGTRLLLDLPENGRVDLRANPKALGDLDRYLSGYSLYDGDGSGAHPAIRVKLIPPRETAPSGWHAKNVRWQVTSQRVEVVYHVPNGRPGFVDFRIERASRLPGVACNLVVEKTQLPQRDFYFEDPATGGETVSRENVVINPARREARVTLFCRDFGGWCRITATLHQQGVAPSSAKMDVPRFREAEPQLPGDSRLPALWRSNTEFEGAATDDEDRFWMPLGETAPPQRPGDGFTAFEEYRGFWIGGRHWRLNEKEAEAGTRAFKGGPKVKDVFLLDRVGTYRRIDAWSPGRNTPPTRSLERNRFFNGYRTAVHLLHRWEVGAFPSLGQLERFGPVNFNGDADQCPIAFFPAALSDFAEAIHGVLNLQAPDGRFYTIPVLVSYKAVTDFFHHSRGKVSPTLRWKQGAFLDQVYAHELGHRVGLRHPTALIRPAGIPIYDADGDLMDVRYVPVPPPLPGTPRPLAYWLETDSQGEGVLRYWGLVDRAVARNPPHMLDLERLVAGLAFKEYVSFVSPVTGAETRSTPVLHQGLIRHAGLYSFRLPPGRKPHVVDQFIEVFGDSLMDSASQLSGLQDRISLAEKLVLTSTGVRAHPLDLVFPQ